MTGRCSMCCFLLSSSFPSSSTSPLHLHFISFFLPHVTNPFSTSFSELLQTQVRRQTTKINAKFNKVVVEGMVELIERQDTHFKRLGGAVHDCETMLLETRKNTVCSLLQSVAVCELQQHPNKISQPTFVFVCACVVCVDRVQETTWKPTALRQK